MPPEYEYSQRRGQLFVARRRELGLTCARLARLANVSPSSVRKIERGGLVKSAIEERVASALKLSSEQLMELHLNPAQAAEQRQFKRMKRRVLEAARRTGQHALSNRVQAALDNYNDLARSLHVGEAVSIGPLVPCGQCGGHNAYEELGPLDMDGNVPCLHCGASLIFDGTHEMFHQIVFTRVDGRQAYARA